MSVTLTTGARDGANDGIVDLIDVGSGTAQLEIWTTGFGTLLAELPLSNPAFTASSGGVSTANTITDDSDANDSGTAAVFRIDDRDGTEVLRGSVGTSGEDINFNTVLFVAGDTISITSLTANMPAS